MEVRKFLCWFENRRVAGPTHPSNCLKNIQGVIKLCSLFQVHKVILSMNNMGVWSVSACGYGVPPSEKGGRGSPP